MKSKDIKYDDYMDFDNEKYRMIVMDTICNNICEVQYISRETGKIAGYWAYGWFSPETEWLELEKPTKTNSEGFGD